MGERRETEGCPPCGAGGDVRLREARLWDGRSRAVAGGLRCILPLTLLLAASLSPFGSPSTRAGETAEPPQEVVNAPGAVYHSEIGAVLRQATGIATLNQVAGDGNTQQNSAALVQSAAHSVASVDARQSRDPREPLRDQLLAAEITSGAFAEAMGIFLVNQSAGEGNSQFNGAAMSIGGLSALAVVQLNDTQLQEQNAGVAARSLSEGGGAEVSASADLAPDAFQGARGLFLVNQAAGNNNATANTFTLSSSP